MQIELSNNAQAMLTALTSDGSSASEIVELAIAGLIHLRSEEPPACIDPESGRVLSPEELRTLVQEGLADLEAGRVAPLDIEATKQAGRERLAARRGE